MVTGAENNICGLSIFFYVDIDIRYAFDSLWLAMDVSKAGDYYLKSKLVFTECSGEARENIEAKDHYLPINPFLKRFKLKNYMGYKMSAAT